MNRKRVEQGATSGIPRFPDATNLRWSLICLIATGLLGCVGKEDARNAVLAADRAAAALPADAEQLLPDDVATVRQGVADAKAHLANRSNWRAKRIADEIVRDTEALQPRVDLARRAKRDQSNSDWSSSARRTQEAVIALQNHLQTLRGASQDRARLTPEQIARVTEVRQMWDATLAAFNAGETDTARSEAQRTEVAATALLKELQ